MGFLFDRNTWQEIFGSISKNRTRTIITVIGVLWGIFIYIALSGAAKGLDNGFDKVFKTVAINSMFVWAQSTSMPYDGFKTGRPLQLKLEDVKTIQNTYIVTSVFWLSVTVILGLLILLNGKFSFFMASPIELLKAHAALGLIGWFMMLVMGVASILLPMFFIVHNLNKKYIKASYYLSNAGLLLFVASLLFQFPGNFILISGILITLGVFFFVRYNFDAYQRRLRKKLDIGMKLTVLSFLVLAASLCCGILLFISPPFVVPHIIPLSLAFGVNLLLGFFTSLILGQMYKTLPFIIWLAKYQNKVGKFKTPLPADLYSDKLANGHYYSFLTAIIGMNIAIFTGREPVLYFAILAFIITAVLYTLNTLKIVFHKEDLKPLK